MVKELKVKIFAVSNNEVFDNEFKVYEIHTKNGYGNGKYIGIYLNGNLWRSVDVRYWKGYEFKRAVDTIFKDYYGDNLKEITII